MWSSRCYERNKNAHKKTSEKNTEMDPHRGVNSLDIYINPLLPHSYLAGPLWLGSAPAPSGPAARGAQWRRARRPSSLPGSPPGLYSACPSSAAAGSPPPAAGPPPHAAGLQRDKGALSKPASQPTLWGDTPGVDLAFRPIRYHFLRRSTA